MALWQNALKNIEAMTGTTYQVKSSDFGKILTNRGLTALITATLPPTAGLQAGFWVAFYGVSAYGFAVASSGSSDDIIILNDAGADSITMNTTSRIIGAYVEFIWDGTSWLTIRGDGLTYVAA